VWARRALNCPNKHGGFRPGQNDDVLLKARLALTLGNDKKTIQKAATLRSIYNQIDSSQAGEVTVNDMLQVTGK
jgi:hypothetical protein